MQMNFIKERDEAMQKLADSHKSKKKKKSLLEKHQKKLKKKMVLFLIVIINMISITKIFKINHIMHC